MSLYNDEENYYKDDDDYEYTKNIEQKKKPETKDDDKKSSEDNKIDEKLKVKLDHVTNTSNYETDKQMILITPEQAQKDYDEQQRIENFELTKEYANPVFAQAVKQVEDKLKRKINYDEFDKMCKTYAGELANADARSLNRTPREEDYDRYYNDLIQNKTVKPLYKNYGARLEAQKVDEIYDLYLKAKDKIDSSTIKSSMNKPINIRHKGKVEFQDFEHRKKITINNESDVKLLHMQYRKDFLDKRFSKEIQEETGIKSNKVHDNEGFE